MVKFAVAVVANFAVFDVCLVVVPRRSCLCDVVSAAVVTGVFAVVFCRFSR